MIKRGIKTIERSRARNNSQNAANIRLNETVVPFNHQVINALSVDYVPITYYNVLKTGKNCTCEKHDSNIAHNTSNTSPNTSKQDGAWNQPENYEVVDASSYHTMFGDQQSSVDYADEDDSFAPLEEEMETFSSHDSLFAGSNNNCGICYRSGFVPGYSLQRGTRNVLTTYDIVDADGYHIDSSESPYEINKLNNIGYVEYKVLVPKYYIHANYSIRHNQEILRESLYNEDGDVITNAYLNSNRGKLISVRVAAPRYTHVVIEFHYNMDPILGNIPNISKTLDYTLLETIGNLQVILPPVLTSVNAGDLIAIPTRNLFMKVVDIEDYSTSFMRKLEWRATCRILQPQEALRNLFKAKKF